MMASCASPGIDHMDRFTDCELSDMLAFFDRHENGLSSCPLAQADAGLVGLSSSDAEEPVVPKHEQSGTSSPVATSTSTAMPSYPAMGCGLLGSRTVVAPGAALLMAGNGALFCAVPQALQAQDYSASMQQAAQQSGKESKLTVSHSTIEKQRRDRINSLIDELRELVPSTGTMKGPDGADMKRPKHVVLSDTINLLKALKEQADKDEQQLQQLKQLLAAGNRSSTAAANGATTAAAAATTAANASAAMTAPAAEAAAAAAAAGAATVSSVSAQSLLQRSLSGPAVQTAVRSAAGGGTSGSPATCPELPQAPSHLPAAVGVLVEEGPGCYLVKVNCKDRHGLLSDITSAIGGLPLQITRAAITTGHGGAVYDVFEIVVEPDADLDGVTALDIQFQVHQALHKYKRAQAARAAAAAATAGHEQPCSSESQNDSSNKEAKRRRSE